MLGIAPTCLAQRGGMRSLEKESAGATLDAESTSSEARLGHKLAQKGSRGPHASFGAESARNDPRPAEHTFSNVENKYKYIRGSPSQCAVF